MTDCPNTNIRDLLPEHVHGLLSEADTVSVERHVRACEPCTEELALLRTVLAIRVEAPAVNVAALVAKLPMPGQKLATPSRSVSFQSHGGEDGVRPLASAPSAVRKAAQSSRFGTFGTWKIAAVMTLVAAGGMSVLVARQGFVGLTGTGQVTDSVNAQMVSAPESVATVASLQGSALSPRVALSVGELSDYSDAELESLIRNLEKWDGTTAAEPLPGMPLLPTSSGTSR